MWQMCKSRFEMKVPNTQNIRQLITNVSNVTWLVLFFFLQFWNSNFITSSSTQIIFFVSNMSACLNNFSSISISLLLIFTRMHMFANAWDWLPLWLRSIHVAKLTLQEPDEITTWMIFMTNALRRHCNDMYARISFEVIAEHSIAPIWVKLSSKCSPERLTILETGAHSLAAKSQTCP